jgi:orotate phosphoribosyltransferase
MMPMMPQLIPPQEEVMEILKKTGAFREGHFVYPSGQHTPHYFQMPLAFRYYDTARVLAVALSRKFRTHKDISSALPKVSIISPGPGGIPVAFGVREALNAEQIYWAERERDKRMFRQYVNVGEVNPAVIVDDISRTGGAIEETVEIVRQMGTRVIGCGAIVRFTGSPDRLEVPEDDDPIPVVSLIEFDAKWYDNSEDCAECKKGVPVENVRF